MTHSLVNLKILVSNVSMLTVFIQISTQAQISAQSRISAHTHPTHLSDNEIEIEIE